MKLIICKGNSLYNKNNILHYSFRPDMGEIEGSKSNTFVDTILSELISPSITYTSVLHVFLASGYTY